MVQSVYEVVSPDGETLLIESEVELTKDDIQKIIDSHYGVSRLPQRGGTDKKPAVSSNIFNTASKAVQKYSNLKYGFGSDTETKKDCSSFISCLLRDMGVNVGRMTTESILNKSDWKNVSRNDLSTGDLIVLPKNKDGVRHVGMYVGNSQVVHLSSSRNKVVSEQIDSFLKSRGGKIEAIKRPNYPNQSLRVESLAKESAKRNLAEATKYMSLPDYAKARLDVGYGGEKEYLSQEALRLGQRLAVLETRSQDKDLSETGAIKKRLSEIDTEAFGKRLTPAQTESLFKEYQGHKARLSKLETQLKSDRLSERVLSEKASEISRVKSRMSEIEGMLRSRGTPTSYTTIKEFEQSVRSAELRSGESWHVNDAIKEIRRWHKYVYTNPEHPESPAPRYRVEATDEDFRKAEDYLRGVAEKGRVSDYDYRKALEIFKESLSQKGLRSLETRQRPETGLVSSALEEQRQAKQTTEELRRANEAFRNMLTTVSTWGFGYGIPFALKAIGTLAFSRAGLRSAEIAEMFKKGTELNKRLHQLGAENVMFMQYIDPTLATVIDVQRDTPLTKEEFGVLKAWLKNFSAAESLGTKLIAEGAPFWMGLLVDGTVGLAGGTRAMTKMRTENLENLFRENLSKLNHAIGRSEVVRPTEVKEIVKKVKEKLKSEKPEPAPIARTTQTEVKPEPETKEVKPVTLPAGQKAKFYISVDERHPSYKDSPFREVEGTRVDIVPYVQTFVHKDAGKGKGWMVSEVSTGLRILPTAGKTRAKAIEAAHEVLKRKGREKTLKAIENAKARIGTAPEPIPIGRTAQTEIKPETKIKPEPEAVKAVTSVKSEPKTEAVKSVKTETEIGAVKSVKPKTEIKPEPKAEAVKPVTLPAGQKAKFYIAMYPSYEGMPYREVEGTSVDIVPYLRTFVHKDVNEGKGWMVSEVSTGVKILSSAEPTRAKAIEAARKVLEHHGREKTLEAIEGAKARTGSAPQPIPIGRTTKTKIKPETTPIGRTTKDADTTSLSRAAESAKERIKKRKGADTSSLGAFGGKALSDVIENLFDYVIVAADYIVREGGRTASALVEYAKDYPYIPQKLLRKIFARAVRELNEPGGVFRNFAHGEIRLQDAYKKVEELSSKRKNSEQPLGHSMNIENLVDFLSKVEYGEKPRYVSNVARSIKEYWIAVTGRYTDRLKMLGDVGEDVSKDIYSIFDDSAHMSATYGWRMKKAIQKAYGRLYMFNSEAQQALTGGLVRKIEAGRRLSSREAQVWKEWVEIVKDIKAKATEYGVGVPAVVGRLPKNIEGKIIWYVKDGRIYKGIIEKVNDNSVIVKGGTELKAGEPIVREQLVEEEVYFMRALKEDVMRDLGRKGSAIQREAIEHLKKEYKLHTDHQALAMIREFLDSQEKTTVSLTSPVRSRLSFQRLDIKFPEHFYDRHFLRQAHKYIEATAREISIAKHWGMGMTNLANRLSTTTRDVASEIEGIIDALFGRGLKMSHMGLRLASIEGMYTAFTKLTMPITALIQLAQTGSVISILGLRNYMSAVKSLMKDLVTGRHLIEEIQKSGTVDQTVLELWGFSDMGGLPREIVSVSLIQLSALDKLNRLIGAQAGIIAGQKMIKAINFNSLNYKETWQYRTLTEYGHFKEADIRRMQSGNYTELDIVRLMSMGVKPNVRVRPVDLPPVMQTFLGRIVGRLKTFHYGQYVNVNFVLSEARRGNFVPAARLLLSSVIIGEGVQATREFLRSLTKSERERDNLIKDAETAWEYYKKGLIGKGNRHVIDSIVGRVLDAGSAGLYGVIFEAFHPKESWKEIHKPPAYRSIENVIGAIIKGVEKEKDLIKMLREAFYDISNEEILWVREIHKALHKGKTRKQVKDRKERLRKAFQL